jgi:UDP-glucose 6-dehydrogenase
MKIAIAGTGYVGFSSAMLLAQHNEVITIDIVPKKVTMLSMSIPKSKISYNAKRPTCAPQLLMT